MLNPVNFHRFTYKQVEESAPMHRMHEDFLLSKTLRGITKMMEFLLDLYFPYILLSLHQPSHWMHDCLWNMHPLLLIQTRTPQIAASSSPHFSWTLLILSTDLQIPLQLQSNDATQTLPAWAFHSQSAEADPIYANKIKEKRERERETCMTQPLKFPT